jgi:outer membrane protein assembly factor BamB
MKKILQLLALSLLVSACDFIGKTKQIVEFTPSLLDLHKDISQSKIVIDHPKEAGIWSDATNIANVQPSNISISDLDFTKFKNETLKIRGNSQIISSVVASDKDFFMLDGRGNLYSFAIEGFEKKWELNLADDFLAKKYVAGSVIYKDGIVYISYGSNDIVAVDAVKGIEKWRRVLPDIIKSQLVVDENKLYVLTVGNRIHAINRIDGTLMWDKREVEELLYHGHSFAPLVSFDRVYVPYLSGVLTVFNKKNAEEIWSKDLVEDFDYSPALSPVNIQVQPILTPHSLYIASPIGELIKISMHGDIIWSSHIQDIKSMSHSANSIFVTTNGREVAAIDKNNGKLQWVTQLYDEKVKKREVVYYSVPMIVNGKLHIAASNGELFVISPVDGVVEQKAKVPSGYLSTVIAHGRYFMFTEKGAVFHNN